MSSEFESNNGYLKFTGEYGKLKSMGYTFQRMYAANYMCWHKNELYIYKRGADITSGHPNLYKLITFLRTNPAVRRYDYGISFFKFYTDLSTNEYEYLPVTEENKQKYIDNLKAWGSAKDYDKQNPPQLLSTEMVSTELLEQLQELKDLGWYELVDLS